MNFGKQFAENTEAYIKDGIIMDTFPDFYIEKIRPMKGLEAEKEISLSINDIQVKGFIDAWDVHNNRVIDFKTSGKPWIIDTLKNSLQMKVYALAMFTNGEEIPVSQINWLGTKKVKNEIQFTGESYELTYQFKMKELLEAVNFIFDTAKQISKEYITFKNK
jgi:hypothetical protein